MPDGSQEFVYNRPVVEKSQESSLFTVTVKGSPLLTFVDNGYLQCGVPKGNGCHKQSYHV